MAKYYGNLGDLIDITGLPFEVFEQSGYNMGLWTSNKAEGANGDITRFLIGKPFIVVEASTPGHGVLDSEEEKIALRQGRALSGRRLVLKLFDRGEIKDHPIIRITLTNEEGRFPRKLQPRLINQMPDKAKPDEMTASLTKVVGETRQRGADIRKAYREAAEHIVTARTEIYKGRGLEEFPVNAKDRAALIDDVVKVLAEPDLRRRLSARAAPHPTINPAPGEAI